MSSTLPALAAARLEARELQIRGCLERDADQHQRRAEPGERAERCRRRRCLGHEERRDGDEDDRRLVEIDARQAVPGEISALVLDVLAQARIARVFAPPVAPGQVATESRRPEDGQHGDQHAARFGAVRDEHAEHRSRPDARGEPDVDEARIAHSHADGPQQDERAENQRSVGERETDQVVEHRDAVLRSVQMEIAPLSGAVQSRARWRAISSSMRFAMTAGSGTVRRASRSAAAETNSTTLARRSCVTLSRNT